MNNNLLISIVVITYNSEKYILQTLESIKNQNYRLIEVIVSDDGSNDLTVQLCKEWFSVNEQNFVRTELLHGFKNSGIPANCNRGIIFAKGDWVKIIAGDDLLHEECLSSLFEAIALNPSQDLFAGRFIPFYDLSGTRKLQNMLPNDSQLHFFNLSASKQFQYLLKDSFNFAPTVFIKRSVFSRFGLFEEKYLYLEDLPYWLRLTNCGLRFALINKAVVYYRTNHSSMVFSAEAFYNKKFMDCLFTFKKNEVYKHVPFRNVIFYQGELVEYLKYLVILKLLRNRKSKLTMLVNTLFNVLSIKKLLKIVGIRGNK